MELAIERVVRERESENVWLLFDTFNRVFLESYIIRIGECPEMESL